MLFLERLVDGIGFWVCLVFLIVLGVSSNFVWMDPRNPQVINFLGNIIVDSLQYDIDGVQLDDHFAMPVKFGQNRTAMDHAALVITNMVRSVSPKTIFSLSPNTVGHSRNNYNVDWIAWF